MDGDVNDGVMTNQDAIEQGLADQDTKDRRDQEDGEMLWSPYNPMLDEARIVRSLDPAEDLKLANQMLQEARRTVTFMRARLHVIVRAQEMTDTVHGVRRGRKMSQRTLVDTAVDLRSGRMPNRAYQITDAQIDTSFALSLCLDQSYSMSEIRREVAKCMMVMADSVEGIKGKTFAFGFRNGDHGHYDGPRNWGEMHHRVRGVRYDVFKTWEEGFNSTKWRFAHTQAQGTTPMSDGVQFGIQSLNDRQEAHRVLAVITDGCPDRPHEKVIRRQIRLARAGGIHVIGIGIGDGAIYVQGLFGEDNAVWAPSVAELPIPLMKKLNDLCDFSGKYRGRRAKLDGKITRKVS
jgi:nitric oxide reductase activation protein